MAPPSRQVLTALPDRTFIFLYGVGTSRGIRAAMIKNGYAPNDHAEGWRLLDRVSGRTCSFELDPEPAIDPAQAAKVLEKWERSDSKRLRAAIVREHPKYVWLFDRLPMPNEASAAPSRVGVLVGWLDDLESSERREATRKDDHAVLDTLAARGLDKDKRRSLATLCRIFQWVVPTGGSSGEGAGARAGAGAGAMADKAIEESDLLALRAWYVEWSTVARATIERGDWLEKVGLQKRKVVRRKKKAG